MLKIFAPQLDEKIENMRSRIKREVTEYIFSKSKRMKTVFDYVNKPTLYGLVGVLEYEFNYGLPFRDWEDKEVIQFIQDFLNGKTEYKIDDKFPKEVFTKFLQENK